MRFPVNLPLRASPIAVSKRPGEPSPVLAPLHLVQAGFPVGEHPHPVPAPFTGAVGAPTSFRACHHSIPLGDGPHDLRERKVAERRLLRQSCPDRCVTFPGEGRIRATRPRRGRDHEWLGGCGRRRGGERPIAARWVETLPRVCGVSVEPDVFLFYKNLWPGASPEPPQRHSARHQGRPPGHGSSPETRGRTQDPHDRRARGACLHALEILTSDRPGPVAYRACTSTSGCMCTESPSPCARAGAPYVAARVAVAPRPHERRCRSRVCGRGGSDPGVRHASHATAMVGMCTPSHPRLGVTPGHQSLQEGRLRRLKDSATSAVIPSIRSTPVQRRWTGSPEPARR